MVERVERWYFEIAWREINKWLCQFAAKGYNKAYLENFAPIPSQLDRKLVVDICNRDSNDWKFVFDDEGDIVCKRIAA